MAHGGPAGPVQAPAADSQVSADLKPSESGTGGFWLQRLSGRLKPGCGMMPSSPEAEDPSAT
eukprot:2862167-Amphidinium_carterae.2